MTRDLTRMVHTIPSTWSRWKGTLRRATYLLVLFLLIAFLADLGAEPWLHALENWPTFLVLILTTGTGLVIQARAFSAVSTGPTPPRLEMLRIWSASAVVSVVAPLFAGIATRTTLLVQHGMSISNCLSASLRQVWMGVEYALLIGSLAFAISELPHDIQISTTVFTLWIAARLIRTRGVSQHARIKRILGQKIRIKSETWFALQIAAMSATFFVGFNAVGAEISLPVAFAISSATVLVSLIAFVPNGLGITDAIWVLVATHYGVTLEESVSLAILLRVSHLSGSVLIYFAAASINSFLGHGKNPRWLSTKKSKRQID